MNIAAMTSITFQNLSQKEVLSLAKKAGLSAIEWCANPHVSVGDIKAAKNAYKLTKEAGLEILSYSTYFKAGNCKDAYAEFLPVLNTAIALRANIIRIWAGDVPSKDASTEYIKKMVHDTRIAADMAKEHDINIYFEYHRKTLSDNPHTILKLLKELDRANVKSYWQPNPELSLKENLYELKELKEYLSLVHVFNWNQNSERLSLANGVYDWQEYTKAIDSFKKDRVYYILEFVKNDCPKQFLEDAKTLHQLLT